MINWIRKFISGGDGEPTTVADQQLLLELRDEVKECEALYRSGARLCSIECPQRLEGGPKVFQDLMLDLHRGLLIKVFVEIARCDRRWHAAEREAALILLQHVWGVEISQENLVEVLRNVADLGETLEWTSLLGPFMRLPPLREQAGVLSATVVRIGNLIAKADGRILKDEAQALRTIESELSGVLHQPPPAESKPMNDAIVGSAIAQHLMTSKGDNPDRKQDESATDAAEDGLDKQSREQMFDEAMQELNQLIGLQVVKDDIQQLVNFLKMQKERKRHGLPPTHVSLHTVFQGNPGTGKTTVARIIAGLFGGLGLLKRGHLVETDRSGLVARYAGQTGPRVSERVDEALDGVLFVDEAYSLVAERGDDPFGSEAVQVLLKRMEDDRERVVVIIAGYPLPMERMLQSNPGLSSRFQRTFQFDDFTPNELVQIFEMMCSRCHYVASPSALSKLLDAFQTLTNVRSEHFGNGRVVRNAFEKAIRNLANRIVDRAPITRELLMTLEPEDVTIEVPAQGPSSLSSGAES